MAIQFKQFKRPAFSGTAEELKRKDVRFCNSELKAFRVISISEAKGVSDDFYNQAGPENFIRQAGHSREKKAAEYQRKRPTPGCCRFKMRRLKGFLFFPLCHLLSFSQ